MQRKRHRQRAVCPPVWAWLFALCALGAAESAPADPEIAAESRGPALWVRTPFYEIGIRPDRGGRIVSCVVDGADVTRVGSDGHGGLFEEVHSADSPFRLERRPGPDGGLTVVLTGQAGALRIVKELRFYPHRPAIDVQLTFENRSNLPLAGRDAPALRSLILPAGRPTGREVYCLARGGGTEVLSQGVLIPRLYREIPLRASLRWLAVGDPAGRRAVGFAPYNAGCRPVPPLRSREGGILLGWSYPAIGARSRLHSGLTMAPLAGFGGLCEINKHFAADCFHHGEPDGQAARIQIVALRETLSSVSLVARAYDAAGRQTGALDAMLFDSLTPGRSRTGMSAGALDGARPAWFLHDVYSRGKPIGRFAVPVGPPAAPFPHGRQELVPPVQQPIERSTARDIPGPSPVTGGDRERGFWLARPDGTRADAVQMELTREERRTVFLQLRALRPAAKLNFALAGGPAVDGASPIPPAGLYLWRVQESGGSAVLEPLPEMSLRADENVWLALTADAAQLSPGLNVGHIAMAADQNVTELPLRLRVHKVNAPRRNAFALWYLGAGADVETDVVARARLIGYGASAMAFAEASQRRVAHERGLLRAGFDSLLFRADGGVRPPLGTSPAILMMNHPRPIWLLLAGAAAPGSTPATLDAGYAPAIVCERLGALPAEALPGDGSVAFYVIDQGCEPDRVPELIKARRLKGTESILLHLDLRDADWRAALSQVSSALWAAAWQGLAGVAVTCEPPRSKTASQLAIWHILRNTRHDVALWRELMDVADRVLEGHELLRRQRELLVGEGYDRIVGREADCLLRVVPQDRPFRQLYRVAPGGRTRFEAAQRRTLELLESGPAFQPPPRPANLAWLGIPVAEGDRVHWALVAPKGEKPWQAAIRLQAAIRDATSTTVPLSRTMPRLEGNHAQPSLIWVLGDSLDTLQLPEQVDQALIRDALAPLVVAQVKNGPTVAVLRDTRDVDALIRTWRPHGNLYRTARHVR